MVKPGDHLGAIAAIGNFDGVHRGHRQLLTQTIRFANKNRTQTAALVFEPHPRRFFRPDDPPFLLTTPARRRALLLESGIGDVISLPFDAALAAMSPVAFVNEILKARFHLSGVVTGTEFRFGKGRAGDAAELKRLCELAGMSALLAAPLIDKRQGVKIGSSAIRAALAEGDVRAAEAMLGRPWSVAGDVIEGRRLGRTLGFPTANFPLGDLVEPRRGVYAVLADVQGKQIRGIANFGRRPTIEDSAPLLETHLFDFDGDLYGQTIEIAFLDFIRDERKFSDIDALKKQIAADCDAARHLLTHRR